VPIPDNDIKGSDPRPRRAANSKKQATFLAAHAAFAAALRKSPGREQ